MHNPPWSVIASWPRPNYIDPVTRGPGLVIVNVVLLVLMLLVVGLRFYTRMRITKSFGADDIFIGLALVFAEIFIPTEVLI